MLTRLFAAALLLSAALPIAAQAQTTTTNPLRKPAPATAPAAPAAAPAATPAATPATAPAAEKKAPSEKQLAQRNKMKACGAEWQSMKKANKTEGKTWKQFSSECLKRS